MLETHVHQFKKMLASGESWGIQLNLLRPLFHFLVELFSEYIQQQSHLLKKLQYLVYLFEVALLYMESQETCHLDSTVCLLVTHFQQYFPRESVNKLKAISSLENHQLVLYSAIKDSLLQHQSRLKKQNIQTRIKMLMIQSDLNFKMMSILNQKIKFPPKTQSTLEMVDLYSSQILRVFQENHLCLQSLFSVCPLTLDSPVNTLFHSTQERIQFFQYFHRKSLVKTQRLVYCLNSYSGFYAKFDLKDKQLFVQSVILHLLRSASKKQPSLSQVYYQYKLTLLVEHCQDDFFIQRQLKQISSEP